MNKHSGYSSDGRRLYHKGGDGGAGQMRADEAARQAKIQAAVDAVNGTFSGANRAAMYTDIGGATRDVATRDLDKQFTQASKQNLFGLARSGLLGGSVDAEASGDLQQRYGEGKIKAEQAGVGAASDLQSTDERTRQNLISLAQSGIDTGTAAQLAAGQMSAAAQAAQANSGSASVGRLFDDLGQAYLTNTNLRARYPNGLPAQQQGGNLFSNLFSGKAYTGNVTP
jgi:hypothetical protein